MSLRDELDPRRSNGGECSVRSFLAEQDNAAEWQEILNDPTLQHSQVWRLMKRHGFALTDQPVKRHRKGECNCAQR